MKKLIAATISLSLLGTTAAMADSWGGRDGYYGHPYRHEHYNDAGPAIAVGLGFAALALIASQHQYHDRYYARENDYQRDGYYSGNRYARYRRYDNQDDDDGY